jgi:hypothetical protein
VPMLLASIEGSIGMRCAFGSGRRTGEPGQQARHDGGPGVPIRPNSPTRLWVLADPGGTDPLRVPLQVAGSLRVGCLAGGLVCRRLPRSLTSLGGLVPARRRAQTQALSASVGRPGRPFPPPPRLPSGTQSTRQASPQVRTPHHLPRRPWRLTNEAGGHPGRPHPSRELVPPLPGTRRGRPHRPCHPRAISSGHERYPADNHGHSEKAAGQGARR